MSGGVFLYNLCVARHQEVHYDIDVGPVISGRYGASKLEAPQVVPLMVAVFLKGFDKSYIFAVAQGRRVETEVHVSGSGMRHVSFAQ